MGYTQIKGKLTSRIDRPVKFGAPKDVQEKGGSPGSGTIVDEMWATPEINQAPPHKQPCSPDCWGDYSFCSQLIKWDNADFPFSIRLAYYRRRCGEDHWEYASQTTVNDEPKTIKVLLELTLAKTTWFQESPMRVLNSDLMHS